MEGDGRDIARREVGDGGSRGVEVGGEGGGADEAGGYDVWAGGGVAVAEEMEEVGVGHGGGLLHCIAGWGGVRVRLGLAVGVGVDGGGGEERVKSRFLV